MNVKVSRAAISPAASASRAELRAALEAERRDILRLYQSLAPPEWQAMLCTRWTVRDMLAHLVTNDTPWWAMLTSGFNGDRANQKLIKQTQALSHEQLLEKWAIMVAPKGLPAATPGPYLADDWAHNQDVRWPLNRPRQQNPAHMRLVLEALIKPNRKRLVGLHLKALDICWEYGQAGQPEVAGNAEALAMGIANRPAAKGRLSGNGVARLFV